MRYLTGVYALNTEQKGTDGDWHWMCLDWNHPEWADTHSNPLGTWGIIKAKAPHLGEVTCATHARACLDLLMEGQGALISGMRKDFIDNEALTPDILAHALVAYRHCTDKESFDHYFGKEYLMDWLRIKEAAYE